MIRIRFARSLGVAAVALAAAAGAAAAQGNPPAAEVVAKYLQAIGGRDAAARFASRHLTAEMSVPAMGVTAPMEIWYARPNRMLVKMDMAGMAVASGSDGTVVWANSPMTGPRILAGAERMMALDNANFDNNVDFAKVFPTMETVGERTVDGHACWNVRMVSAAGTEVQNCFDKESGLLIGSIAKQPTEMGEATFDAVISDYRDFDGLKLPTRTVVSSSGQQLIRVIKTVSHGPVADSIFALPPEIRALQH